jgi:hypothetical protein
MSTTFALIIGIDSYSLLDHSLGAARGHSDLRGARNDVHSMAMLVRMMEVPSKNIRVLSDPLMSPNDFASVAMGRSPLQPMDMIDADFRGASRQEILDGLAWLSAQVRAHDDAQGIIYFSGHSVLTASGHPCLCPADVQVGAGEASSIDTTHPDVIGWYLWHTLGLKPLARLLGTRDAGRIAELAAHLDAQPDRLDDPREGLREAAALLGIKLSEADLTGFIQNLSNVGEGTAPVESDDRVRDWLKLLKQLSASTIDLLLSGDPLAADAGVDNLISFNRAFFSELRDTPEDRNVHIILDTCMQGTPHSYYSGTGIPLAHGGMVMMSSCLPGQSSERAVFDNRWHGAFTWGLVSLLSQTPVFIAEEGRSFTTTYEKFNANLQRLLKMFGFEQNSGVWAQPAQQQWRVFGTTAGKWRKRSLIPPVRVEEEIDAGTTGSIYQINDLSGGRLGFLIRPQHTYQSWQAGQEYWVWDGVKFPSGFKLVRPAGSASTFEGWIDAINPQFGGPGMVAYSSQVFSSGSPPINNFYKVTGKPANQVLCAIQRAVLGSNLTLTWRPAVGCPMLGNRISFMPAAQVVLQPGQEIWFEDTPGPPVGISLQEKVAEDTFPL